VIGILTFYWADDYGALLQCCALKAYLGRYRETVVIPYFPKPLRRRYRLLRTDPNARLLRRGYELAGRLIPWRFYRRWKRKRSMRLFRRRYLTRERRMLSSSREIAAFSGKIDTYVAGSDQVWNPEITEGLQEGYFCTFRRFLGKNCRYVSYAASIGAERLEDKYRKPLARGLACLDAVSLREPASAPYIETLYAKKPAVVLDPVFLIEKRGWEALIKRCRWKKRGYIAVYDTEYHAEMAGYLEELERNTGLAILVFSEKRGYRWTNDARYVYGCGPLEFLAAIRHAGRIVTNSFHATAFSILFEKPFVVFAHSSRNARIQDLLKTVCLEKRLVRTRADARACMEQVVDWPMVRQALEKEILRSKAFIEREIILDTADL